MLMARQSQSAIVGLSQPTRTQPGVGDWSASRSVTMLMPRQISATTIGSDSVPGRSRVPL